MKTNTQKAKPSTKPNFPNPILQDSENQTLTLSTTGPHGELMSFVLVL